MKYDLPRPSMSVLIIQCALVLAFAVCLYLFLTATQSQKNYASAIIELNQKKQSLNKATNQLDRFLKFVSTDPYYQRNTEEPQWEKIDEIWVDLPYNDLLQRLADLYRADRPFVLDYFSASLKDDKIDTSTGEPATTALVSGEQHNPKLVFNLQGYFLCPCR